MTLYYLIFIFLSPKNCQIHKNSLNLYNNSLESLKIKLKFYFKKTPSDNPKLASMHDYIK
jgi:hypothetical protein